MAAGPHIDSLVVDTDVHMTAYHPDIREAVAERMSKPYRFYATNEITDEDSGNTIGGRPVQHSGWPKTLGGKKNTIVDTVSTPEDVREDVMETYGIDIPIINTESMPDRIVKTAHAREEARAYNDVLVERFLDEDDDMYGLISVSSREPDKAAEEIDRMGDEDQVVGVYFWAGHEYQKPLGHPMYDIMYEAMEDNGLTPVYHIAEMDRNVQILRHVEKFTSVLALNPFGLMVSLVSLVNHGVPEKFPDLNFAITESGISWVPYMMSRLNREYGEWRAELPLLEKSPEEYIRDSFYFSTQPLGEFDNPQHMQHILEIMGPDNLMFSSDHPHHDFDNLKTIYDIMNQAFDEEGMEKFTHKNAIEAFNIPV